MNENRPYPVTITLKDEWTAYDFTVETDGESSLREIEMVLRLGLRIAGFKYRKTEHMRDEEECPTGCRHDPAPPTGAQEG